MHTSNLFKSLLTMEFTKIFILIIGVKLRKCVVCTKCRKLSRTFVVWLQIGGGGINVRKTNSDKINRRKNRIEEI